MTKNEDQV